MSTLQNSNSKKEFMSLHGRLQEYQQISHNSHASAKSSYQAFLSPPPQTPGYEARSFPAARWAIAHEYIHIYVLHTVYIPGKRIHECRCEHAPSTIVAICTMLVHSETT